MSEIWLFIDEDSMDLRFIRALRARKIDIITVGELGTICFSDEDQLILATEQQRVLYTFNSIDDELSQILVVAIAYRSQAYED
jgi:hypothetical protein